MELRYSQPELSYQRVTISVYQSYLYLCTVTLQNFLHPTMSVVGETFIISILYILLITIGLEDLDGRLLKIDLNIALASATTYRYQTVTTFMTLEKQISSYTYFHTAFKLSTFLYVRLTCDSVVSLLDDELK